MGSAARLDVGSCSNGGIGLAWISENSIWTEYFFLRHGDKIIFVGRFVAILRIFAAMLAGINRVPPWRFSLFNVLGGITWAVVFGAGWVFAGTQLPPCRGNARLACDRGSDRSLLSLALLQPT